jgi:ABC-2 type transport system ATP-binding protein
MSTPKACVAESDPDGMPVQVRSLNKLFGTRAAVAGLTLAVGSGSIVGLVGSNGGGKTTALRMLAGLLPIDGGEGRILGHDLKRRRCEIRERVGYMAQQSSLYVDLSVRENLRFRAEVYAVGGAAAATKAVMEQFELTPLATRCVGELSGGWARQVQLAGAVMHAPRVLILDEPTTGLDIAAREAVWRQIVRLAVAGTAVILSTHDLADAARCSQIAFLTQGVVRATGTPEEVARTTAASVVAVRGARVLSLAESLRRMRGVQGSYPHGGTLRVLVEPQAAEYLRASTLLRGCDLHPVPPTLEDVMFEWTLADRAALQ